MTTPVGSVRITAEADAGDFGDDLVKVVKAAMSEVLAGVVSGMRQVNAELTDVDGTGFADLSDEAQRASRQVDDIADVLDNVARSISGIEPDELTRLGRAAQDAAGDVDALGDAARQAGEDAEKAAEKGGSAFEGMGEKAAAVAGGLAIGELIGQSIDQANLPGRFAIQLGLTQEESAKAATLAGEAFRDGFGGSLDEVAEATSAVSGNIAKIGTVSDETFKSMTESALLFATNMNIDVGEASKTAGVLLKNGLAKDGVEAFDLLTKAAQVLGPQLAQELPSLVDAYTIAFSDIGLSGEEAFNHFAVFADQGVEAMDKAGDSVKEFGIKMKTMDTAAGDTLTSLGINADEAFAAFKRGGPDAQAEFEKVMAALRTSSDQTGDALALFGSPLEELGTDNIPKFIESLSTSGGAMDGFRGTLDAAKAANEGASKSFDEALRSALGGVTDALAPVVQLLGEHPGIVQGATFAVLGLAAAYVTFKGAMAVKDGIGAISDALDSQAGKWVLAQGKAAAYQAATGAKAFGGMIANLAKATLEIGKQGAMWVLATGKAIAYKAVQLAITTATKIATAVQAAFNLVLSLNPIGLIVIAIAAVVGALVLFFTKTEIGKKLLEGFFNFLSTAWDVVKAAFSSAAEFISGIWTSIVDGAGAIVDFFVELPGNIIEWLGDLGAKLIEWFGMAWDFFVEAVKTYLEVLSFIFTELPGKIIGWLGDIGAKLGEWFAAGWQLFLDGIGLVIDGISFVFTELPGKIIGWLGDIGAKIGAWFSAGWELFKAGLGLVIDTVSTFFTGLVDKIVGWAGDLASKVGGWFSEQWANFKAGLGATIDTVATFFTGLPGKILGWLGNLGSLLVNAGKNVIDGLVNGLRNAGSAVKDFLLGLMSDAKDAVLGFFGIESPSKVFAEIGKNLMLGMAGGIDKNGSAVVDALGAVNDAVAGTEFEAPSVALGAGAVDSSALGAGAGAGIDPEALVGLGESAALVAGEQVAPALTAITDGLNLTGATAATVANDQVVPSLGFIGDQATALAEQFGLSITDGMIPTAQSLGDAIANVQANGIQPAFNAIQNGLSTVQSNFGNAVTGIGSEWDKLRGATARPVNFMLGTVWNQGLFPAWNKVAEFLPDMKQATSVATIPGFRTGGALSGPGTGTSDDILMWGSTGEHMVTAAEVVRAGGQNVLYAIRDMIMRGVPFTWDNGKVIGDLGKNNLSAYGAAVGNRGYGNVDPQGLFDQLANVPVPKFATGGAILPWMLQLQKGHQFAQAQHGKPYQWAGPSGEGSSFDCSGFMGSVAAAILDQNVWQRYWATASFAGYPAVGPQGFVKGGDNGFTIGVTDDPGGPGGGHTAGTLGALPDLGIARPVNVESGGSLGDVHYGGGTDPSTFASMYHLPIGANGFFVGGGAGPTPEEMREFLKTKTRETFDEVGPINKDVPFSEPPIFTGIPKLYVVRSDGLMVDHLGNVVDGLSGDPLAGAWVKASAYDGAATTFDTGGILPSGGTALNQSGKPERILSPEQTAAFDRFVAALTGGRGVDLAALISEGIEVYRAECKKSRDQEALTTEATQSLAKDLGADGAVGQAIVAAANASGDLTSILDTSGLFAGRTVTLTADEVRQKQIEDWQKFLDSLKAEHDKAAAKDGGKGATFDLGGVISGPGLFASGTSLPERVLSPRQTAAFEELVARITGPLMSVPDLKGSDGRGLRPNMTAGDMHFHFPNAREPKASGQAVQSTLRDLLDR